MRPNVRPLTYWIIHQGYKVRFKKRSPELVQGIVTASTGEEIQLDYDPVSMTITLPDKTVVINHGGFVQSEISNVGDLDNKPLGNDD